MSELKNKIHVERSLWGIYNQNNITFLENTYPEHPSLLHPSLLQSSARLKEKFNQLTNGIAYLIFTENSIAASLHSFPFFEFTNFSASEI